ncbi:MAG: histidinol dehydrogenase [Chitinophagaceae bacterium]|nr:histidinol dehydrogenase [Chitinophagaceae bacterium]MBP7108251.1 histidinol dehydrogenase [Chitinophagaceae bacterium]HQX97619.1 histidinol dehydrogenase [Chitinophagaceae bacterium]
MKQYEYPDKKEWAEIVERPIADYSSLEKKVKKMMLNVKKKGDKAVFRYCKEFDGVKLKSLAVNQKEIDKAILSVPLELKTAIIQAKKNIELFHNSQKTEVKKIETMPGVTCWRQSKGIEKVGLYIPGGTAPLFSTVLMLAIPAQIAECKEIILCTPPDKKGKINAAISFAAQLCGITKIYKVGGVQAIAAMTFGTESIPKVFKIFGPGNQYVTMGKQMAQQYGVAIDMPAGPSEVLVIADETADPEFVAADLLSQAEHGPDSQVILITTDEKLSKQVNKAITSQLQLLPRKVVAERSLKNSKLVIINNIEEAIELSDLYAPEHLIIICKNANEVAQQVSTAGSVFIGNYSPESAGDYGSGTNHTLPTNGYAAMYSGVSLDSFVKKITYQELTKEGLENIGQTVMTMAAAEGLDAHKNAISIRLKK